jgi:glycosyltransferase involved in cell wall biosynthesis
MTPSITYVLLSPTFGMHQYTADLANRAVQESEIKDRGAGIRGRGAADGPLAAGHAVQLVTTTTLPRDRYSLAVEVRTPVTTHGTGFSREGLDLAGYRRAFAAISYQPSAISHQPSTIVHFTGVHLWNVPLVYALRRRGFPVVHTLHDLDPHHGVRHGWLIRLWNRLIIASGCHILVHGRRYRDQLLAAGLPAERVTYVPLLHGFLSGARDWPPSEAELVAHGGDLDLKVLFFGRVEAYKGVETLLAAWRRMAQEESDGSVGDRQQTAWLQRDRLPARLVIAGPVAKGMTLPPLPPDTELRDRRIADDEAEALFRSAAVLVLPYRDATQSALVAAAYAFGVPVIVTDVGALPEYVIPGVTGWVVPAGDAAALAAALCQALADPARLVTMGSAGRGWFETRRREEQARFAALYQRCLVARS